MKFLTRESSDILRWIGKERFEEDGKNHNDDEHEEENIVTKWHVIWEIAFATQNNGFLTLFPMHTDGVSSFITFVRLTAPYLPNVCLPQ